MKKFFVAAALVAAAVSCKKLSDTSRPVEPGYLGTALVQLRDSLSPGDFQRLDTNRWYETVADSGRVNYLRIAFRGLAVSQSFVLVRTDGQGKVLAGRIVDMVDLGSARPFDSGSVTLRSLGGQVLVQSGISKGFVLAFHSGHQASGAAAPAAGGKTTWDFAPTVGGTDDADGDWEVLPEVVVTPGDGGIPNSYYSFTGLLGENGSDGASYFGVADPSTGGGAGGSAVAAANAMTLQVQPEYTNSLPVINVQDYFQCFALQDPNGATYTLQLCTDIPVNGDPDASYDVTSGGVTVGHSFLVVTMSGPSGTISQSFGFYPAETPAFWNPTLPVPSSTKDNGGHEINASITISISAAQLLTVQAAALSNAQNQYSLLNYNCTDYALGVFNSVAPTPVSCQPFVAYVEGPIGDPPAQFTLPNSPEGLYNSLAATKSAGGPQAPAIQTDLSGNTLSPASHGSCP